MLHLRLSWCTSRWHKQCLAPRKHKYWSTSRLRFQPLPDLLRLQTGCSILSLSCPPSTLALVVEYIAPSAGSVCSTCACRGIHRACTSIVFGPRQYSVLDYLAPAPVAYAAHIATTTSGFGSLPVVPTSIPAPVVQYIAPTPVEYAAPAPVMSTSRQHKQFLTPCPAQILEYLAPAFAAYAATLATVTGGFGSLFVDPPSSVVHACRVLCTHGAYMFTRLLLCSC